MFAESYSRGNTNSLIRWWATLDRWTFAAILSLLIVGVMLSFAASPSVAMHLKLNGFYFVKRHLLMIAPALALLFGISLFSPKQVRRFATLLFLGSVALMIMTLFTGVEIKGAKRWVSLGGFSLQPSEFLKPAFSVLVAWMLAEKYRNPSFPGIILATSLLGLSAVLLLLQPDLGMTIVVVTTWLGQLFIGGIPLFWVWIMSGVGAVGLLSAYFFFPHVSQRIDQFFSATNQASQKTAELYQVSKSLHAFSAGGFFGKGPGEGIIKKNIPDAHADFVFAVAGEEFGVILCIALVLLFSIIVIRSLIRVINENSLFLILATSGLVIQFGLQALINMASSLNLIPTKGMTLPFISYGGSSMLALAITMGMVLSLTRKHQSMGDVI